MTLKKLQDAGADLVSEIDSLIEDVALLNLKVSQERCKEAVDRLFSGHEVFGTYFHKKAHSPHPEQGACLTIPREDLFWSTGRVATFAGKGFVVHQVALLTSYEIGHTENNQNVLMWSVMQGIEHARATVALVQGTV